MKPVIGSKHWLIIFCNIDIVDAVIDNMDPIEFTIENSSLSSGNVLYKIITNIIVLYIINVIS